MLAVTGFNRDKFCNMPIMYVHTEMKYKRKHFNVKNPYKLSFLPFLSCVMFIITECIIHNAQGVMTDFLRRQTNYEELILILVK